MEDVPSTSLINKDVVLKLKRKSSKLPLRRLKLLLNKRRTRFWNLN